MFNSWDVENVDTLGKALGSSVSLDMNENAQRLAKFPSRATSLNYLALKLAHSPEYYEALRFLRHFGMLQIMKLCDLRRTISVAP